MKIANEIRNVSLLKYVLFQCAHTLEKNTNALWHKNNGSYVTKDLELCLSFSQHPNISDGNFNLDHCFFRMQLFQINEKGTS